MNIIKILIFVLTFLWYQKISARPILIDRISVIVNNQIILQSDIDYIIHVLKPWSHIDLQRIVKELILNTVLLPVIQQTDNTKLSDEDIHNTVLTNINRYAEDFHLSSNNLLYVFLFANPKIDSQSFHNEIDYELRWNNTINSVLNQTILVTPSEVNAFLKKHFNILNPFLLDEYQDQNKNDNLFLTEMYVRHILINYPLITNNKASAILRIIADHLKRGTMNFSRHTKQSDEQLEWILPQKYHPSLRSALLKLSLNEISPPISNEDGWHLLQLLETRKMPHAKNRIFQEESWQILENLKIAVETCSWIHQQRNHAYVKIIAT
ncbi:MAG: peptidylprolyl isomerase [Candidatus Dasytiphilus stammeri]